MLYSPLSFVLYCFLTIIDQKSKLFHHPKEFDLGKVDYVLIIHKFIENQIENVLFISFFLIPLTCFEVNLCVCKTVNFTFFFVIPGGWANLYRQVGNHAAAILGIQIEQNQQCITIRQLEVSNQSRKFINTCQSHRNLFVKCVYEA